MQSVLCLVLMYPEITPPQVQISAVYPGASAQVVEESVIRPIEEQINGVEDMMYIESTASNNGSATITVFFKVGIDDNMAQVNVQNRVALAQSSLPSEVTRLGVTVKKKSSSMLMAINLYSEQEGIDQLFLSNYATNSLTEPDDTTGAAPVRTTQPVSPPPCTLPLEAKGSVPGQVFS